LGYGRFLPFEPFGLSFPFSLFILLFVPLVLIIQRSLTVAILNALSISDSAGHRRWAPRLTLQARLLAAEEGLQHLLAAGERLQWRSLLAAEGVQSTQ
jgi:hypothetical protein